MAQLPLAIVVEDDASCRAVIRAGLEAEFRVQEFADASSAIRALWTNPDLVVLDLVLPDAAAAETVRVMLAANDRARVLVVSGQDRTSLPEAVRDKAGWTYLSKPFDENAVRDAARRLVPRRSTDPIATPAQTQKPNDGDDAPPPDVKGWPAALADVVDRFTRRGLRFAVSVELFKLAVAGKSSPEVVLAMIVAMVGVDGALAAWRQHRAATVVAAAVPVALSIAGQATDMPADAGAVVAALGSLFVGRFTSREG